MPRYRYTVISRHGDVSHGKIDADSKAIARERLQRKKLQVAKISLDWTSLATLSSPVKTKEVVIFTRQMAAMADAGLSLTRSLSTLYEQSESKRLRSIIQQVLVSVESGETFAAALAHHPGTFPSVYTKLVHAGESSGRLDEALVELADYLERIDEINSRVKSALAYPVVVTIVTMIALVIIYVVVLPKFEDMFEALQDLPLITRWNLAISRAIRENPTMVLAAMGSSLVGLRYAFINPLTRNLFDRWGIRLPIIGSVIRKAAIARFTSTFSTMLGSGINLMEALLICANVSGNTVVREAIEQARRAVAEGDSLAGPLQRTKVFPPMVTSMIAVGEETGDLQAMLKKVSGYYEKDVKNSIDAALEMIKPITMILLAIMVIMVLFSVYIPMYDSMINFGQ